MNEAISKRETTTQPEEVRCSLTPRFIAVAARPYNRRNRFNGFFAVLRVNG